MTVATAEEIEVHFMANQLRGLALSFNAIDAPTAPKQSSSDKAWQKVLNAAADKLDAQALTIAEIGKHIESESCWCSPKVEMIEGSKLIIHNEPH